MRRFNGMTILMVLFLIILFLSACQPSAAPTDNASAPADTSESDAEASAAPADTSESDAEESTAPADTGESETEDADAPADTSESKAEDAAAPADAGESDAEESDAPADTSESDAEESDAPTDAGESDAEESDAPADTSESEGEMEDAAAPETERTQEEKIANAMSAGPAPIAQEATILDYPEEGRGNWPDEPAPELVELQAGSNGWTCIVDIPDTPGNDPMCLNQTYLEVLMSQYTFVDAPSTGVGFGYMLQGGGPVGSPPHMMVFVPESNGSFEPFSMEPGPFPWIMFPETSQQHLMVLLPPPAEAVEVAEDKIANAMSAGPAPIAHEATILDYPEEGRGNWPDGPAPELIELRAGSNGWTCITDIPDTPGNDPMCLNETYLEVLMSQYTFVDAPSTGVGFGYMLQGGGPIGSPPHMMVFAPESNGSFDAFGTEPGPFPWIMFPETSQQHLMVLGG